MVVSSSAGRERGSDSQATRVTASAARARRDSRVLSAAGSGSTDETASRIGGHGSVNEYGSATWPACKPPSSAPRVFGRPPASTLRVDRRFRRMAGHPSPTSRTAPTQQLRKGTDSCPQCYSRTHLTAYVLEHDSRSSVHGPESPTVPVTRSSLCCRVIAT